MNDAPARGIGDNAPPDDESAEFRTPDTLDLEQIQLQLQEGNQDLLKRRDDLLAATERFDAAVPIIEDDETLTRAGAFVLQLTDCAKESEGRREAAKAPYLAGGAAVDGFYKANVSAPLLKIAERVRALQTAYNNAKAARLRREAEEAATRRRAEEAEQRRRAEEAARKQREAEAAQRAAEQAARDAKNAVERKEAQRQQDEARKQAAAAEAEERQRQDDATRAAQAARVEEKVAESSSAELTRTRGDLSLVSTRQVWKFRVTDITKVPAHYLMVNEKMVNAAIKGKSGVRDIPGLSIYDDNEAINRR